MNQRVKGLWLEALESGEYAKGKGRLRYGEAYCCLGVLCDLYRKEKGKEWEKVQIDEEEQAYKYAGQDCILPAIVQEWAELKRCNPYIGTDKEGSLMTAVSANDDGGMTFKEIAKGIKKNL